MLAWAFGKLWNFSPGESIIIGLAFMFSSTILVVKLLPTVKLHQKRIGEVCIGILILQDIQAIVVISLIYGLGKGGPQNIFLESVYVILKLIGLFGAALVLEQFFLRKIFKTVEKIFEAIFVISLGWGFGISWLAHSIGLSYEIGAFIAGVSLARFNLSQFISEELRPLRDFFLVLFFFSLGALIQPSSVKGIAVPAGLFSLMLIGFRPLFLKKIFKLQKENPKIYKEASLRLGQASEFTFLVGLVAFQAQMLSQNALQFIQLSTIVTMVISTYIVISTFPTPISPKKEMLQD